MKKEFSIYLDLVRFVAAFLVLIYHSDFRALSTAAVPFSSHGHAAVIVFFILSGYVISFITTERENSPVSYWASRLSRFYLLVVPVVLVTPLLDTIGQSLAPHFYEDKTTNNLAWLRIMTSLSYMNEIWNVSIMSFSNVPFWSLCYEMWYYVMFAVVSFMEGRKRIIALAVCALIVGPKIVLLAPIWALGVILHRWKAPAHLSESTSWGLFIGSIVAYGVFQHFNLSDAGFRMLADLIGQHAARQLTFSRYFITDYLLAVIVAAHFIGVRNIAFRLGSFLLPAERVIRWIAALTFPLYIMHQPLLQFFAALFNGDPGKPWFYLAVIASTLVTVAILGVFAEQKRPAFKHWMALVLAECGRRLHKGAADEPASESMQLRTRID